jgi:hypothetical protein
MWIFVKDGVWNRFVSLFLCLKDRVGNMIAIGTGETVGGIRLQADGAPCRLQEWHKDVILSSSKIELFMYCCIVFCIEFYFQILSNYRCFEYL